MAKQKQLEDYYSGDEAWAETVEIALRSWTGSDFQKILLQKVRNDLPLAAVIFANVGEGCLEWLETRVPALSRRKPIACLEDPNLRLRLRQVLMRMY